MPTFEYVALAGDGKREKGLISSDSERAARKELRVRQLTPVKLQEAKEKKEGRFSFLSPTVSGADRLLITRQWAMMIDAGSPVEETLAATASQAEKPGLRRILLDVRNSVTEGHRFADALAKHPKVFNSLYCSIVSAGETSGQLGPVLQRLDEYLERSRKVRQTITTALIYPSVLGLIAIGVITALMTIVVPQVVEQFDSVDQDLPMLTQIMIAISDILRGFGLFILIGIVGLIWLGSVLLKRPSIKRVFDAGTLRLPVIGKMLVQMNSARFARTLSTLLGNGAPVLDSLTAAKGSLGHAVFQDAVGQIIVNVREGSSISRAMKASEAFPPLMVQLAASGEASGKLPEMLTRSATFLEDEFEATTKVALGLMEPLIILFLGGMVGLVVLSIMLPILQLNTMVM